MDDTVRVRRDGAVLRLQLNRPDRVNAFAGSMHTILLDALADAARDDGIRAVLLTGAGRAFCAGQDLAAVPPDSDLAHTLQTVFNPLVRAIRGLPKPVVCAVHGVAAGAGANLALACDVVLAGETARFLQAFVNIGLIPDAGGTWLLPRLVGDARARGLAMLGEPLTAPDAASWGLIWRCVPDDSLLAEADATVARLAALPTRAIGLMKRAFDAAASQPLDAHLGLEEVLQSEAGRTADFPEGVAAFLAKRPPVFTGR